MTIFYFFITNKHSTPVHMSRFIYWSLKGLTSHEPGTSVWAKKKHSTNLTWITIPFQSDWLKTTVWTCPKTNATSARNLLMHVLMLCLKQKRIKKNMKWNRNKFPYRCSSVFFMLNSEWKFKPFAKTPWLLQSLKYVCILLKNLTAPLKRKAIPALSTLTFPFTPDTSLIHTCVDFILQLHYPPKGDVILPWYHLAHP